MEDKSKNYARIQMPQLSAKYANWEEAEQDLWELEDQPDGTHMHMVNHKYKQVLVFSKFEISFINKLGGHYFANGAKAGRKEILANVKFK